MSYRQKKEIRKHVRDAVISRDIIYYGSPVLHSDAFHRAFSETHHLRGSVSDHSLTVCIATVRICLFLQKAVFRINEKDLIQASLCHDLGMIGRSDKYRRRTEAWHSHPADSVAIARELLPDLSENAVSMIRTHMWPVSGSFPRSREAVILNAADKFASSADWVFFLTGKQFCGTIRKKLRTA